MSRREGSTVNFGSLYKDIRSRKSSSSKKSASKLSSKTTNNASQQRSNDDDTENPVVTDSPSEEEDVANPEDNNQAFSSTDRGGASQENKNTTADSKNNNQQTDQPAASNNSTTSKDDPVRFFPLATTTSPQDDELTLPDSEDDSDAQEDDDLDDIPVDDYDDDKSKDRSPADSSGDFVDDQNGGPRPEDMPSVLTDETGGAPNDTAVVADTSMKSKSDDEDTTTTKKTQDNTSKIWDNDSYGAKSVLQTQQSQPMDQFYDPQQAPLPPADSGAMANFSRPESSNIPISSEEDLSPEEAEQRLKDLGVPNDSASAPEGGGVIQLPDGTLVLVSRRESVKLRPISQACSALVQSPEFSKAVDSATSSVRTLMQDRNAESLRQVRASLVALSAMHLEECDPKTAAALDNTLATLDSWSASQSQVAAAQKEVEEAERRVAAARANLQQVTQQASTVRSDNQDRVAKTLPSLYAGLRRWSRAGSAAGGGTSS